MITFRDMAVPMLFVDTCLQIGTENKYPSYYHIWVGLIKNLGLMKKVVQNTFAMSQLQFPCPYLQTVATNRDTDIFHLMSMVAGSNFTQLLKATISMEMYEGDDVLDLERAS